MNQRTKACARIFQGPHSSGMPLVARPAGYQQDFGKLKKKKMYFSQGGWV
jgi:hypothetical protein